MLKTPWLLLCIVAGSSQMGFANFTSIDVATTPPPDPVITLAASPLACNAQLSGNNVALGSALVNDLGPQLTCTITLDIKNGGSLKSLVLTHNGNAGARRTTYYSCSTSSSGNQNCGDKLGSRHVRAWFKVSYIGCGLHFPVTKFITAPGVFHAYAQTPYSFPVYLATDCADNDSITIQLQHYLDEDNTFWGQPNYGGNPGFVQELSVTIAPNAPQPAAASASMLKQNFAWLLFAALGLAVM